MSSSLRKILHILSPNQFATDLSLASRSVTSLSTTVTNTHIYIQLGSNAWFPVTRYLLEFVARLPVVGSSRRLVLHSWLLASDFWRFSYLGNLYVCAPLFMLNYSNQHCQADLASTDFLVLLLANCMAIFHCWICWSAYISNYLYIFIISIFVYFNLIWFSNHIGSLTSFAEIACCLIISKWHSLLT